MTRRFGPDDIAHLIVGAQDLQRTRDGLVARRLPAWMDAQMPDPGLGMAEPETLRVSANQFAGPLDECRRCRHCGRHFVGLFGHPSHSKWLATGGQSGQVTGDGSHLGTDCEPSLLRQAPAVGLLGADSDDAELRQNVVPQLWIPAERPDVQGLSLVSHQFETANP